ncbi:hypothetical protein, partial [Salmonella enterica]|uniref:hypothetical protein n=1 Tax=Salmonella enterica TaxID=28901 RepID=UPI00398C44F3
MGCTGEGAAGTEETAEREKCEKKQQGVQTGVGESGLGEDGLGQERENAWKGEAQSGGTITMVMESTEGMRRWHGANLAEAVR